MTITLILGLALLAIAVSLALLRSPMTVARTTGPFAYSRAPLANTARSANYCQAYEVLPQGTSAIRISLFTSIGPRVRVIVLSRGHMITSGEQSSAWTGGVVTVPVRPLPRPISAAMVCASFRLQRGIVTVLGERTSPTTAARDGTLVLAGRMRIEYLHPGSRSWASLIPSVVRHMGFGRATAGSWIVLVALALTLAVTILSSSLILKDLP